MKSLWTAEPTMILAVVSAGIALAIGFGAHISTQQMGLIMAFVAAVLGLINRSQVTSPAALQNMTPQTLATAQDAAQPVKDVVKKLPALFLAIALLGASSACSVASVGGRSTAQLTAPGVQALHTAEVVRVIDVIRDTAVDGEATKVISTPTAAVVVKAHKAIVETMRQLPNGWKATVLIILAQLKSDLPAADRVQLAPYIDAAVNTIKAVIQ